MKPIKALVGANKEVTILQFISINNECMAVTSDVCGILKTYSLKDLVVVTNKKAKTVKEEYVQLTIDDCLLDYGISF